MKCKPYSEITVEIRTQLKTVKITSNIFAVHLSDRIVQPCRLKGFSVLFFWIICQRNQLSLCLGFRADKKYDGAIDQKKILTLQ